MLSLFFSLAAEERWCQSPLSLVVSPHTLGALCLLLATPSYESMKQIPQIPHVGWSIQYLLCAWLMSSNTASYSSFHIATNDTVLLLSMAE